MSKKSMIEQTISDLVEVCRNNQHVLCLIGLGSVAQPDRLDDYSDIDFFLIVKDGQAKTMIEENLWLRSLQPVYAFRNTVDGYKILLKNEVFLEFAIFELGKLKDIPYRDGVILYQLPSFPLKDIDLKTGFRPHVDASYAFEECLTNLHIGLLRLQRGERLAAQSMIQRYAFDHWFSLSMARVNHHALDPFNNTRRFEVMQPDRIYIIKGLQEGYEHVLKTAILILDDLKLMKQGHVLYAILDHQIESLKETHHD